MIPALQQLAVSLGIGLLLGLQRERTDRTIGGIRTFPLIALLGTVCAQLGQTFGGWVVAAGLLGLAAIVLFANFAKLKSGAIDPGMTTEIAALLLYGLGAYVVIGSMAAAVVLGGAMALLLHLKKPMHAFAGAIGEHDMRAIMQFVFLTLVILPVLPSEDYGPFGVWNPFHIWLMVVLIVSISLSGYVAYKFFGDRAGTLIGGVLGGLISSTATTVSYARRTKGRAAEAPLAALVIMIAAVVSLGRVIVEIVIVAPRSFPAVAPPLIAMLAAAAVIAGGMYFFRGPERGEMPAQTNPAELKSALVFGGLYAVVSLAVAAAREHMGSAGLFAVAGLSGLTDMDAITISSARMVDAGQIDAATGWRAVLIASIANFAFKFGTVAMLGHRLLTLRVGAAFALAAASGGLILWMWPA